MGMLEIAFVMAPGQNHFFVEFVAAIRHELRRMGVSSFLSTQGFPASRPELVYIVVSPHEFFFLEADRARAPDVLRRTILVSAEQPGTSFFERNVRLAQDSGAVFDINAGAVREYRERGVQARLLQLGYSDYWEPAAAENGDHDDRDVDIVFIGSKSDRRSRHLASYDGVLSRWRHTLVLSDNAAPNYAASSTFLVGADKLRLLRRSRVLINLHQGGRPYFEWLRVVEAIHSGCAVVSEISTDHARRDPWLDVTATL